MIIMKRILFTLLALVGLACANAAETINVTSIEENFYVPSDAQYEPYYRCDMFAEDGLKYSFVIEKRLDSNGMPVDGRAYTLSDMDDWASYVMGGMYEYYDFTSVNFVRTVTPAGKVNITAKVTDERKKSYTLVYGESEGQTYTFNATMGQAAYYGTYTGVNGDWNLLLADGTEDNPNIFAEICIITPDGEHIAGNYSMADGTVSTDGTTVFYVNGKSVDVKSGSINLSCIETESGPAYNINAAFKDANGNNYVINRSIIQFFAYDILGYMAAEQTGQDIDYMITLKDTETTAIDFANDALRHNNDKAGKKFLRDGKIVIKRDGKTFNVNGVR